MVIVSKRLCYNIFIQTIFLLFLYSIFALREANLLTGDSPVAIHMLRLAALTGLIGGGLYVVIADRPDELRYTPLLRGLFYSWVLYSIVAVVMAFLDSSSIALQLMQTTLILGFVGFIAVNVSHWSPIPAVWAGGMTLYAFLSIFVGEGCFTPETCAPITIFISWSSLHIALTITTCALGFWLMHRFSNISWAWGRLGLKVMIGWLTIAGIFIGLSALSGIYDNALLSVINRIGVFFVPLAYIVYGSHSYRALSDQNGTKTLAPHWYTLGLLLFMGVGGALGGLSGEQPFHTALSQPVFIDLRIRLIWVAVTCICLGIINQAAAEMRGENRRVTGLMPFWLIAFGLIGGQLAYAIASVVQVILEHSTTMGALEIHTLLRPFYQLWMVGHVLVLAGVILYGLGFWARRLRWTHD